MSQTIKNMAQLQKAVEPYITKALEKTRDDIFEIVMNKVSDYYNEPVFSSPDEDIPDMYQRTGTLMESFSVSHIQKVGNYYSFTVGADDDYLTFRYPGGFTTKTYGSKYNAVTGQQVLEWFNSSSHGGTVAGSHDYWDEAIQEIENKYGGIDNLFKTYLKKMGLPIM